MASDFNQNSPYIYTKFEVDGRPYCLSTHVPKPNGWQRMSRAELDKTPEAALAREVENNYKLAGQGEITEEEFLDLMRVVYRRLRRVLDKTAAALYIVSWVWERTIRNRPDRSKVSAIVRVMDRFLTHLRSATHKPTYKLNASQFKRFGRHLKKQKHSGSDYNSAVSYLHALANSLRDSVGCFLARDLKFMDVPIGMRKAFSMPELKSILRTLRKLGQKAKEWRTIIKIILNTSLRPCEAFSLRKRNFYLIGKIRVISVMQGKTKKLRIVVINDDLWDYLEPILKPLEADDLLARSLYHLTAAGRSNEFKDILLAAGIKLIPADFGPAKQIRYTKCLYALRKTHNVWQQGRGRTKKQRAKGLGHSDMSSIGTYDDDADPFVLEQDLKFLNTLPKIKI